MRVTSAAAPVSVCGFLVLILGCAPEADANMHNEQIAAYSRAVAVLYPTEGYATRGVVTFSQSEAGTTLVADIEGLEPGLHGFHIHEFGDCSATDGTSAGGHFNPAASEHGAPSDSDRHVGDLGNVTADQEGRAHYEFTDGRLVLTGPHSIVGRGVVVHAGEDDLTTQPTGASGARVACGVVGIARD